MTIKGFDELAKHVPELNTTNGRIKIAAIALSVFTLTTFYFIITDQIPTWTLDSEIVVIALGFLFLSRLFTQKKMLIEKHKDMAYHYAATHFIVPGIAILFAAISHIAYMNGPKFTQGIAPIIMHILGWYFLIIGAILWVRSVLIFGFDNLAMLYVYFPNEGKIVNSSIYSILRHPVYAGALRVGIGLALLNSGIFALTFALFLPLGFIGWVRLIEEKELLERFPNYVEYRKHTPAFWPRLKDVGKFFRFIFTGN